MQRHLVSAVLSLAACAVTAAAQPPDPSPAPGARKMTILAGSGIATAGTGVQLETYFQGDRLSAFAGVGYSDALEGDDDEVSASGAAVAAGLRAYTRGRVHRGFLELSGAPVAYEKAPRGFPQDDLGLLYGPSLQAGWQMTKPRGFTLVLAAGVGYAFGNDAVEGSAHPVAFLGLGKTWRRK